MGRSSTRRAGREGVVVMVGWICGGGIAKQASGMRIICNMHCGGRF